MHLDPLPSSPAKVLDWLRSGSAIQIKETDLISLPGVNDLQEDYDSLSFWLRLECDRGQVEGKLHLASARDGALIIFEPGYPGDGSTRLERRHVSRLLTKGYSVFACRHAGTIINGPHAIQYLNCSQRQTQAKCQGEALLGTREVPSISDWLKEPLIALLAFGTLFSDIYLIGHSFGVLAILHSLHDYVSMQGSAAEAVHRVISLSGATGRIREVDDPILQQWREHLDTPWALERIRIGDAEMNIQILTEAYLLIHSPSLRFPPSAEFTAVSPWGDHLQNLDELVSPLEALDMIASLGRGSLLIDKTEVRDELTERMVHDMDNVPTAVLLDLLSGTLPRGGTLGTLS